MWTRRGQFFLVLREVSLKLSSYFSVENRLVAFSQKGGLLALPPAASSRTWRDCPSCCRAIWGPEAALLPPWYPLSLGSISQLFMEMTPCSGRDSVPSQMIMQSRHALAEMSWDFLFLCISSANALKISWEGSLGIFSMNWHWPDSLLWFLPPKTVKWKGNWRIPFHIPSLFSSYIYIKNCHFSTLYFNNCCSIKTLLYSTFKHMPTLT